MLHHDLSFLLENTELEVINKLTSMALEHTKYIKLNNTWLDDLCSDLNLQNAEQQNGFLLTIIGECGSGKSVLEQEIVARSELKHCQILTIENPSFSYIIDNCKIIVFGGVTLIMNDPIKVKDQILASTKIIIGEVFSYAQTYRLLKSVPQEAINLFEQIHELLRHKGIRYAFVISNNSDPYMTLIPNLVNSHVAS